MTLDMPAVGIQVPQGSCHSAELPLLSSYGICFPQDAFRHHHLNQQQMLVPWAPGLP